MVYQGRVPPKQPISTKSSCSICDGKQWIWVSDGDEVRAKRCICLERLLMRQYLIDGCRGSDEIYYAKHVKSELYRPETDEQGKVKLDGQGNELGDRTLEDLFLKGDWGLACQHLRWCLVLKYQRYPEFTFRLVDDQRLVTVYVGNEAYKNKASGDRDDGESNNSLNDLVSSPDLLLIRLGVLSNHNKAAANTVLQALTIRSAVGKPVWLIEGDRAFGDGHRSYNYELGEYINSRYEVIDLRSDKTQALFKPVAMTEVDTVSMGVNDRPPPAREFEVEPQAKERFPAPQKKKQPWGKKGRTTLPDMG